VVLVNLNITTWRGISVGAVHVYGTLSCDDEKYVRMTKTLTRKTAAQMNKMDRDWGRIGLTHRPGEESECFDTEDDVIDVAKDTYKEHYPKADALVQGTPADCDPKEVLDGPKKFITAGMKLYKKTEKVGGWEGDIEAMEKICDEWDKLVAEKVAKPTKKSKRRKRGR